MKIAYLTNCFGIQSHTFIRREIAELEKLGVEVGLFGIRQQISPKLSDHERERVARTVYLYPLPIISIVYLNLLWMFTRPKRYWPGLCRALQGQGEKRPLARLKLGYHFLVACYLARRIERSGADHIHAHFMNVSATIAMFASLLTGIPYSVTVHSAGTRNAPHIAGITMKLRYAQFLIMISRFNIGYFDDIYPCRRKSTVVRCGMDLDQFPMKPAPERGSAPVPKVLAVGRLVEKKGFRYLIEAAGLLQRRGQAPAVTIVGSGPLEADLRERVAELQLVDHVDFAGPASTAEVRDHMLKADLVVVPSVTSRSGEMEGIPVVLMEAMALGVPVIASRHSGIPELVHDGETGVTVPERDSEALAEALQNFTVGSDEWRERTARARELIETEFNIVVVARQRRDLFVEHSRG